MHVSTWVGLIMAGSMLANLALPCAAQTHEPERTIPPIAAVFNRDVSMYEATDRSVLQLDAREGDGLAIIDGVSFSEGVLELDVRGEDVQGRSFVGIAFHVQDESTYEAVYLRPFNFRTTDAERRRRAVQYVSHPEHPWHRLREESPGTYEAPVSPAPDPDDWVRLRLVVTSTRVHVYAGEGAEPALVVERLGGLEGGSVGFWVGNGSRGEFADLAVTAADVPDSAPVAGQAIASVERLGWMAGCWEGTLSSGATYEESWLAPRAGTMIGMARLTRDDRMLSFEFLRIADDQGTATYSAQPSGRPPTHFPATELSADEAKFENPEHDFPQRILYRLTPPDALLARIEGLQDGQPRHIDFPLRRVACPGPIP